MSSHTDSSKAASTLTITNVRLPPAAYASLKHVSAGDSKDKKHEKMPLVDVTYTHLPSASSSSTASASEQTSIVEVHVAPSAAPSGSDTSGSFDRDHPFASKIDSDSPSSPPPPPHEVQNRSQLVSRFTTINPPVRSLNSSSVATTCIDAHGHLAIPGGLCHPHIHLDKPYLLDRCPLSEGTFAEALTSTSEAKRNFTASDVEARMRRLITASISHGVTSMRAFVEVDPTVRLMCLDVAIQLQQEYRSRCHIQLAAFAQDPIFYPHDPAKQQEMHALLEQAVSRPQVDVLASAPYVETIGRGEQQEGLGERERKRRQKRQQRRNVSFVFDLAQRYGKHVDFHLDYDLDPPGSEEDGEEAMIPYVVSVSSEPSWDFAPQQQQQAGGRTRRKRHVTMGHCTKLSTFTSAQLSQLSAIPSSLQKESPPPISFVCLPPSDLYMQGRDTPYITRSRATFPLLDLSSHLAPPSFNWAMGVNNIANLFTPQGDADPLAMLPMMVAIWQSAKPEHCELLLNTVSQNARLAAGLDSSYCGDANVWSDLTLVDGNSSVQEVVCSPAFGRITIKDGAIVARRRVESIMFD